MRLAPASVRPLRDRTRLEAFLRRDAAAHVYALADLDDDLWPHTQCYVLLEHDEIAALALVFDALRVPILYAVCPEADPATRALLAALAARVPQHCYLNLGVDVAAALAGRVSGISEHVKMILAEPARLDDVDTARAEPLTLENLAELQSFFRDHAYAEGEAAQRFLAPYMLARAPWFGIREQGRLASVAGLHVFSERLRVAALGNVATRPDRRGRGLARAVSAALCRSLRGRVDHVGLNVELGNVAAQRCYESIGFRPVRRYVEGEYARDA